MNEIKVSFIIFRCIAVCVWILFSVLANQCKCVMACTYWHVREFEIYDRAVVFKCTHGHVSTMGTCVNTCCKYMLKTYVVKICWKYMETDWMLWYVLYMKLFIDVYHYWQHQNQLIGTI